MELHSGGLVRVPMLTLCTTESANNGHDLVANGPYLILVPMKHADKKKGSYLQELGCRRKTRNRGLWSEHEPVQSVASNQSCSIRIAFLRFVRQLKCKKEKTHVSCFSAQPTFSQDSNSSNYVLLYVNMFISNSSLLKKKFSASGCSLFGVATADQSNSISAYGLNGSVEYPTFLETLRGVLEGASTGDSIVLLGDFNSHVGNESDTWRGVIGRNGPPDMNSSGVLLLDFCASHSLSITNTMFKHKGAHQYMWYQDT
ncbi:hypothetical protein QTP70_011532 [Hemibagrus guttatus]|uniref:Endonuclease/exonuclease/phosphatase domain-containing protein n=1 Tax=Hemibagrus guttatus TaxID=175788 RepID=A0AAE0RDG2_9TELE|nr:hypothetical protein QTP70_011532 [Hemibagrus guttatus]